MTVRFLTQTLLLLTPLALAQCAAAQSGDLLASNNIWDLSLQELAAIPVNTLASGSATPSDKSASSVTVISRKDIEAMAATDIEQVLASVPGLYIGRSDQGYFPKFIIRGITSTHNPEVLMMINGVSIKTLFTGSRSHIWGGMPVKAIERVEVIRGPGSALYGADAFAGVINIITRSGADIRGDRAGSVDSAGSGGLRYGSYNTKGAWIEQSSQIAAADIGFTLEYETTDGLDNTIEADAQTVFDRQLGTTASRAPDSLNNQRDAIDMHIDAATSHWQYRLGYQNRDNVGTGVGIAEALDPTGLYASDRISTDLGYTTADLWRNWKLDAQLSWFYNTQQVVRDSQLFPPGAFGGAFPNGVIGNPEYKERQARFGVNAAYSGADNHVMRIGSGYFHGDIYEVTELKNFAADLSPLPGGLTDVSNSNEAFLAEATRISTFAYAQDEWRISDAWALTTGLRYDNFSDFGDTFNPRVALVKTWGNAITTRALYGRAFHAPSFVDLYSRNNPVRLGNESLDPETIDNGEFAFNQQLSNAWNYGVTLFRYRIHDLIAYRSEGIGQSRAQNSGTRNGYGGEIELGYRPQVALRLTANLSYQHATDEEVDDDVGESPNTQAYTRLEWDFAERWLASATVQHTGKQKRVMGDTRDPVDAYTTVDLLVQRSLLWSAIDIRLIARNIFDADVRAASPGPSAPFTEAFVPNDFPGVERSAYAEAVYHW